MYRTGFEQVLIQKVAQRSGISERHVYVIYKSLIKGLKKVMLDPMTLSIRLPFIGRFIYSRKRTKYIIDKLNAKMHYLRVAKPNGLDYFNQELFDNLSKQYDDFINYRYNLKGKTKRIKQETLT